MVRRPVEAKQIVVVAASPTGVLKVSKRDENNALFTNPGATITITGGGVTQTIPAYEAQRDIANVTANSTVTVTTATPAGYQAYYSRSNDSYNHPAGSYIQGTSVQFQIGAGHFVDLAWKYISLNSGIPGYCHG